MPKMFLVEIQEVTPNARKEITQKAKQTNGILRQTVKDIMCFFCFGQSES